MTLSWRIALIAVLAAALTLACKAVGPSNGNNGNHNFNNQNNNNQVQNDAAPPSDALSGCAEAVYDAEQEPLALLVVLDRSESMGQSNKFAFAAQAIVQALDQDVFNSVHLGLIYGPTGTTAGPACVFGLDVGCASPVFPQVTLAVGGTEKSTDTSGVRRQIRDTMNNNPPSAGHDGTPMYNTLQAGMLELQAWPESGKRAILIVTDGSFSCTSLSSPLRPNFADCNVFVDPNGCPDWEHPQNLIDLVATANADANTPIETFLVGVPGSDTTFVDCSSTSANAPYNMLDALSSIAYAGSPSLAPLNCNAQTPTWSPPGSTPALPCHFDMTGGNYSAQALADVISQVRSETAGCVYQLPDPGPNQTIDLGEVNVTITLDNGTPVDLGRRSDPNNPCDSGDGCWDYDANNNVELIGAACSALMGAASVSVAITVGCQTIVL